MKNHWLKRADATSGKKTTRCNYVSLSLGELKRLRDNDIDPHEFKDGGSKEDLVKCKPSGEIAVGRKQSYNDPQTGRKVHPNRGNEYDPIGININDLPDKPKRDKKRGKMRYNLFVEYRVTCFVGNTADVVSKISLSPAKSWQTGDLRHRRGTIQHDTNGFTIAADRRYKSLPKQVEKLIDKVLDHKSEIDDACGRHEARLSCVLYLTESERPETYLDATVIEKLARLNADLDFDVYYEADE